MASMLEAGVSIIKALKNKHPYPLNAVSARIAARIEREGGAMSEFMPEFPHVFSLLECKLVAIGEASGRLDAVFRSLAETLEFRKKIKADIISGLAYPAFVYHAAALLLPFISFLLKGGGVFLLVLKVILFLLPPYLLFFLWKFKNLANIELPGWISSFFLSAPIIGKIMRKTDYARFYRAYGIALEVGMAAPQAVALSAGGCANPVIREIFLNTAAKMEAERCSFCEAYADFIYAADTDCPEISMMESGEISGKADDAAKHLATMYQSEAEEAIKGLAKVVPKLIYIAIVIYLAISIVSFFTVLFKKTGAL